MLISYSRRIVGMSMRFTKFKYIILIAIIITIFFFANSNKYLTWSNQTTKHEVSTNLQTDKISDVNSIPIENAKPKYEEIYLSAKESNTKRHFNVLSTSISSRHGLQLQPTKNSLPTLKQGLEREKKPKQTISDEPQETLPGDQNEGMEEDQAAVKSAAPPPTQSILESNELDVDILANIMAVTEIPPTSNKEFASNTSNLYQGKKNVGKETDEIDGEGAEKDLIQNGTTDFHYANIDDIISMTNVNLTEKKDRIITEAAIPDGEKDRIVAEGASPDGKKDKIITEAESTDGEKEEIITKTESNRNNNKTDSFIINFDDDSVDDEEGSSQDQQLVSPASYPNSLSSVEEKVGLTKLIDIQQQVNNDIQSNLSTISANDKDFVENDRTPKVNDMTKQTIASVTPSSLLSVVQKNVTLNDSEDQPQQQEDDTAEVDEAPAPDDDVFGNACPDTIQSPKQRQQTSPHHCLFYSEYFDVCRAGQKYFPKDQISKELKCKSKSHSPVCNYRNTKGGEVTLACNVTRCVKAVVKVGIFNETNGLVSYRATKGTKALVNLIEQERKRQSILAPFVFVVCRTKSSTKEKIRQILLFPKNKQRKNKHPSELPTDHLNINIIVIDSLSRQHFYRTLPKSVAALKYINDATTGVSEALDFKGMQSLAPFTYVNIHALMNGTIDEHTYNQPLKRTYPVNELFLKFKEKGYHTLLQEDSCWYDRWGSLLTGNEKSEDQMSKDKLWKNIRVEVGKWGVADLGLTHMTCEALKKYRVTSLFDSHKMLCLNGKPISSYLTEYLRSTVADSSSKDRLISYTHINFGHEKTGRRIRALDEDLSNLIHSLSQNEQTVTFLLSDHGGKQSKYSVNTLPGRYEVYDSLFFMLIPNILKAYIGDEAYRTLHDNQNSLVSILDIRDTILKLGDVSKLKSSPKHFDNSLFSNLLADRRDCQQMGIRKYALCKCLSNVQMPSANDELYKDFLMWMAEHVVGFLNNKLSDYQAATSPAARSSRCVRIQGQDIRLVVEERNNYGTVYTFDIVTSKLAGARGRHDVFNFRLFYNNQHNASLPLIDIRHWNRISIYQKYAYCKDKEVPLDLCICAWKSSSKYDNKTKILSFEQFGVRSQLSSINNITCLLLMRRVNGNVMTFEVANLCVVRQVRLIFDVDVKYSWLVNERLPVEVVIRPSQIMFIATFLKQNIDMQETLQPSIITIWG